MESIVEITKRYMQHDHQKQVCIEKLKDALAKGTITIDQLLDIAISYDELTGLMNFNYFKKTVSDILLQSNATQKFSIIYINLVNFRYFNDKYGYEAGDDVLCDFAKELTFHNKMILCGCRDSADKFILFSEMSNYQADENMIKDKINYYSGYFSERENKKYPGSNISAKVGVYIIEDKTINVLHAIDNARLAQKDVNELGAKHNIYNQNMKLRFWQSAEMMRSFSSALANREFIVYYQPKVTLSSGDVVGVEALVRWQKENGKIIPPNDFIPQFEQTGAIIKLDLYVYEEVLKQIRNWVEMGLDIVPVSINLSRCHAENKNLYDEIMGLTKKYNIEPKYIEFEITESAFTNNAQYLIEVLTKFREHGFNISMDDFGAGYSFLNALYEIPVNILKLDKGFLKPSEVSAKQREIIKQVVVLAKNIDLNIVCEGVETKEQAEFLLGIGCDMAQGYFYAKPMPLEDLKHYLNNEKVKQQLRKS
ncbi:putative bifunctional diguanylate cyclase/phosphodiesterase [Anaerosinus sp.]|uniref:putative bifunctional diguanylate cyclase/phosphodiesterase n=1 Tax=Selenobaculum sp. TaxID=3074374 RepID=UPI0015B2E07C